MHANSLAALTQLGFTETEALVYAQLLRSPDLTGYAVAKALQKSQAHIYAALAALESKGAVIFDSGQVRTYRAVSAEELFSRFQHEFGSRIEAARKSLAEMTDSTESRGVHRLTNSEQVYQRAAFMCAQARDSIAFELFHEPFARMRLPLSSALARGVPVAGVTFQEHDEIEGATCVPSIKLARASSWPGDQMTIVTDAQEALVALFARDTGRVLHAYCTDSAYLSCLLHAAVVDAIVLNQQGSPALRLSFNKKLFGRIPSGFLSLMKRAKPVRVVEAQDG
jgi:sugar-specific transcriptional regulator TrmB